MQALPRNHCASNQRPEGQAGAEAEGTSPTPRQGRQTGADVTRSFVCPKCGRPVGAYKRSSEHDWEPQACFWCRRKDQERDAARRRKLGHVIAGVDLDKAFAAYKKLPPFKGRLGRRKIKLEVGHRMEGGVGGRAWPHQRRIRVSAGPNATPERVLEVLVHEMVHLACPNHHHDKRFRRTLRRAFIELWSIDVPLDATTSLGLIAYGIDDLAAEALAEKIAHGDVDTFPPDPKPEAPTKTNRAEIMTKVVEKRETHALTMHRKALTRLKRAKTLEEKWRKKVRYYERQAAKKNAPT